MASTIQQGEDSAGPETAGTGEVASAFSRLARFKPAAVDAGDQLRDFVYARSRRDFARGDARRDALRTPAEVRERQAGLRAFLLECVGGLPPSASPLGAEVRGTVAGRGFTVERVLFQSRPRHTVTANLYLPAERPARTAAVLFLCGHYAEAKQTPEYQVVCQTLVRAGLIVLALDPIGQGERLGYFDPAEGRALVGPCTIEHDHTGAQCRLLGDGLARYFLHDAMRGIDYLATRPEVDAARIGVTGSSGGGTQTSLVMLADPRVAAAAPANFITSRDAIQRTGAAQDAEQIWAGFTGAGFDHEDILLALAPKPVCVLAATEDFFPIDGTRRTVERCRRLWAVCGAADALELAEDEAEHHYTPALARAAATFFARHLLGRTATLSDEGEVPLPADRLQVTRSGQVRAEFPEAEFIYEANLERLQAAESARGSGSTDDCRRRAVEWLRDRVFLDREACPVVPHKIDRRWTVDGLAAEGAWWWTQPGLANFGLLFRPVQAAGPRPVTLAVWDDGTEALVGHQQWLCSECASGRAVFVVNLCGVGPWQPNAVNEAPVRSRFGTIHKLAEDLEWLGDSLAALRTFETIKALDALAAAWPELTGQPVRVFAHGRLGVHGRLAAALDRRVAGWEWQEPFRYTDLVRARIYDRSDMKAICLPGVLKHFDLDEL